MTRARVAVAGAAMITALLLQATLIAPLAHSWPLSLPAVLVAAVALVDGPATGMSFGFAVGLLADLGSSHPAGVLALCWLGIGLVAGLVAERRGLLRDAVAAGVVCGLGASVSTLLLAVTGSAGARATDALRDLLPTALLDAVLAVVVLALVRAMLRTESLRAPHPVYTELALGGGRG